MKNNGNYKEIMAILKFKNYFEEATDFLSDDKTLKQKGFSPTVVNENANNGIVLSHKKQTSGLTLNGIIAQYDAKDIPIEVATANILVVLDKLREARWRFSKNDEVEYINIGVKLEYDITDEDKKLLRLPEDVNLWESKISFVDKFNHTIVYMVKDNKLFIAMDVDNKNIKEECEIKEIMQKVNSYIYNPYDLFKCLGLSTPNNLARNLNYIIG